MSFEANEIIQAFRAFPPNAVYFAGPPQSVRLGFQFYEEGNLTGYRWSREGSVLTAFVQGIQRHAVAFSAEEGALRASCDCSLWTLLSSLEKSAAPRRLQNRAAASCEHVICALLMTLRLLSDNLFKRAREREEDLAPLRTALLGVPEGLEKGGRPRKTPPVYEIVLGREAGGPTLTVRKDGERLFAPWGVPPEIKPLVSYYTTSLSSFLLDEFKRYLKKEGNRYPIFLQTDAGRERIEWDPTPDYHGKTDLNAAKGGVTVRAACFRGEREVDPFARFGTLVVDRKEKKLALLSSVAGWEGYRTLRSFFRQADRLEEDDAPYGLREGEGPDQTEHPVHFSIAAFEGVQINIPETDRESMFNHLLLKTEGEPASLHPREHTYAVTIDPEGREDGRVTLRAECRLGESKGATTIPLFEIFTLLEQGRQIPPALRAQKRKEVLYDLFFNLLAVRKKSEAEKRIAEALTGGDFNKRAIKSEARGMMRHFFSIFLRPELRLRLHDRRWLIVSNDKSKEARLYRIPFELFGSELFRGMESANEMSVPAEGLSSRLSDLHARFQEEGIGLFYKGKTVMTSRWDFSFDARRPSGIDWFEIKPEIRCDGALVDEAVWRGALEQRGGVEKETIFQILDSNSKEILERLAAVCKGGGKEERKEIVRVPRLQIFDWIALRRAGVTVTLSEEDEALITRLTRFERIEATPLPERLAATLRPYQKQGYDWLAFLYRNRFGACLADDMGLGKTLQAITLLAGIREGKIVPPQKVDGLENGAATRGPHLIVVPPSLLFNWENEIARFYPDLRLRFYTGAERTAAFQDADAVLTTYGLVRKDIETLMEIPFHVVIFDEAQAVKNIYADTTGAVRRLKASFKVVMTGTPLENHLGEYYSILDLALPGLLGEYDIFKREIKGERSPLLERLLRRTLPFLLRRTKEEILKELPPKTETDVYLELTDSQKRFYQATVAQIRSTIDDAYRSKTAAQAWIIALTALLKLRQICVSPRLLSPKEKEPSPKIDFLVGRLRELIEAGHSALVFSQFTSFLDLVEEALRQEAIPQIRLDGKTATGKRKKLVEGFQSGFGAAVFLLSLKAGGQGLNLTRASYVFHLDPWWNPAVENQASDRAHRIGQEKKVSITRILMRHTIEEKMMVLKEKKRALYRAVMGEAAAGKGFSITKADFDFLLDGG